MFSSCFGSAIDLVRSHCCRGKSPWGRDVQVPAEGTQYPQHPDVKCTSLQAFTALSHIAGTRGEKWCICGHARIASCAFDRLSRPLSPVQLRLLHLVCGRRRFPVPACLHLARRLSSRPFLSPGKLLGVRHAAIDPAQLSWRRYSENIMVPLEVVDEQEQGVTCMPLPLKLFALFRVHANMRAVRKWHRTLNAASAWLARAWLPISGVGMLFNSIRYHIDHLL